MSTYRLFISTLLIFLTGTAMAATPWPEAGRDVEGQRDAHGWPVVPNLEKVGRGEIVPTVSIGEVTARDGETREQTVTRGAQLAAAFTRQNGFEACALVCENSQGQVALRLTTNFSQVACLTRREQASCPVGFNVTEATLHTHPEVFQARANPVDSVFIGQRRGRLLEIHPHGFSDNDLENGPGYLVAMGRLLHQDGEGTQTEVEVLHSVPVK